MAAYIGIVSKDVVTKNRIGDVLGEKGIEFAYVHSAAQFDSQGFDAIFVDLDSPQALLILKDYAGKCVAFGSANDMQRLEQARQMGCERVFKHGEFYKKFLPGFEI